MRKTPGLLCFPLCSLWAGKETRPLFAFPVISVQCFQRQVAGKVFRGSAGFLTGVVPQKRRVCCEVVTSPQRQPRGLRSLSAGKRGLLALTPVEGYRSPGEPLHSFGKQEHTKRSPFTYFDVPWNRLQSASAVSAQAWVQNVEKKSPSTEPSDTLKKRQAAFLFGSGSFTAA